MGKPVQQVEKFVDDVTGIDLIPDPPKMERPTVSQEPVAREDIKNLPDQKALSVSKERLEQMKRRRGRQSLRQDLALPSVGAGIAIPR